MWFYISGVELYLVASHFKALILLHCGILAEDPLSNTNLLSVRVHNLGITLVCIGNVFKLIIEISVATVVGC